MKVCEITGKVAIVGNNVSHSHHKTKRKFSPNLKTKRFWSEQVPIGLSCRRHQCPTARGG
uniref:50S ribosomal protein L28 n=1 Tax=Alistipes shahii TaxID=328814 RepID=UPI002FDD9074